MEHVCCHVFLPAHVFPSGLGNIPVTEIGGYHSSMEERSSMWASVPEAVGSETPLLVIMMMMLALLASAHQLVLMYQPHREEAPIID